MMRVFLRLGEGTLNLLETIGAFSIFSMQTIKWIFATPFDFRSLLSQLNEVGVKSIPVGVVSSFFVGMVMGLQFGGPLEKYMEGITSFLGGGISLAMVRELAPVLTSILLAGRVGSAMAAEVGTMKVTEQIDALTTLATNPIHYLSVPRFLAAIMTIPMVVTLAILVGTFGGAIISLLMFNIPLNQYLESAQSYVDLTDLLSGISKSIFFGAEISLMATFMGFRATGGAKGVGNATVSAVVNSIMMIIVSDYFISYLFQLAGL
ncbi:MAG: ABC transporter permease [Spirochaetia bacterium]|nr:ABC transporter permease [Spirochaetia bacterium]